MIFISLGTQKFQFNRLLKKVDELIDLGEIKEKVFAQIGYSTYKPKNYEFCYFMDETELNDKLTESTIVITHAGTSSIINSIKREKKTIIIPREKKFGEHVDDHQKEIAAIFDSMNYALAANVNNLSMALKEIEYKSFKKYDFNNKELLFYIEENIKNIFYESYINNT